MRPLGLAIAGVVLGTGCVTIEEEAESTLADTRYARERSELRAELDPGFSTVEMERGARDESPGRWKQARAAYASIDEPDVEAVLAHARTFFAEGRPALAVQLLEQQLERDPRSFEFTLAMGEALLATKDVIAAIEYLDKAAQLRPGDSRVSIATATALILAGRFRGAADQLADVPIEALPTHFLTIAGHTTMRAENPAYAAQAFAEHVRLQPSDGTAWADLGRARLLMKDPLAAQEALATALRLQPADPDVLLLLGHAYTLMGDLDAAFRSYGEAIRNGADGLQLAPLVQQASVVTGEEPEADAP